MPALLFVLGELYLLRNRLWVADVLDLDFNQAKGKAGSPMTTGAGMDIDAGEGDEEL